MTALEKSKYTLEEYFELIKKGEGRLEYWDGEVFDMSGASKEHYAIEGNLFLMLGLQLRARGCQAFSPTTPVKVPAYPPYRYPDLSALCGKAVFEKIGGIDALTNPSVIIEILSPSTEAFDRGDKFSYYQSIPSFREYVLIAQHRPHVSLLLRQDDGSWRYTESNDLADEVRLSSIDCRVRLQEIYEGVSFEPASKAE